MEDYEKLGAFYLGREYDVEAGARRDALLLYDSRDLTTHAVVIGMTGSGKTGLGIGLIEEAALDGVPVLAIDPKGDLGNLLLQFPGLSGAEFRPWIDEDQAARTARTPDALAEEQAAAWKAGLAAWGQDASRIARLRDAADVSIHTPGSSAGRALSLLRSFAAPPPAVRDEDELFAERVAASVTGLLTLAGIDADPRGREHVLVSTVLAAAWRAGEDLALGALIQGIQQPPVARVGVIDLESFHPARERFDLAMRLNALLAAPGFAAWLEGDPLDVGALLYTPAGRPRVSIVSIAHLDDAQRMFVVSVLVNEVVAWMRRQTGTTSLRAVLYLDEAAGYLPPVAAPPSKPGFLTLLKQARAFGLGVVLATQNPADIDYRALSNVGTWMIGRLQTERDRGKVLEGLEGALGGSGRFDRARADRTLAALGRRVFLMHDVHETAPVVFETRWTMSYLRGPLTRAQIRRLTTQRTAQPAGGPAAPAPASLGGQAIQDASALPGDAPQQRLPPAESPSPGAAPVHAPATAGRDAPGQRPIVPPDVPQVFLPTDAVETVAYEPRLYAAAQVRFVDAKLRVDEVREVAVLVPFVPSALAVDFDAASPTHVGVADLLADPQDAAVFAAVPAPALRPKHYARWAREFARWLARSQALALWREPTTGLTSAPGEAEGAFRARVQLAVRERRDAEKARLEKKYAPKIAAVKDRIRRAEERVAREADQASQQKLDTALSVGATVLGALFGRRAVSAGTIGRATTAARQARRSAKERRDVAFARENLSDLQADLVALEAQFQAEAAGVDAGMDAAAAPLERVALAPRQGLASVRTVALAWVPASKTTVPG